MKVEEVIQLCGLGIQVREGKGVGARRVMSEASSTMFVRSSWRVAQERHVAGETANSSAQKAVVDCPRPPW